MADVVHHVQEVVVDLVLVDAIVVQVVLADAPVDVEQDALAGVADAPVDVLEIVLDHADPLVQMVVVDLVPLVVDILVQLVVKVA